MVCAMLRCSGGQFLKQSSAPEPFPEKRPLDYNFGSQFCIRSNCISCLLSPIKLKCRVEGAAFGPFFGVDHLSGVVLCVL